MVVVAVATLVKLTSAVGVPTTVTCTGVAVVMLPMAQIMVAVPAQAPWVVVAVIKVKLVRLGNTSVKTTPRASEGPAFVMKTV